MSRFTSTIGSAVYVVKVIHTDRRFYSMYEHKVVNVDVDYYFHGDMEKDDIVARYADYENSDYTLEHDETFDVRLLTYAMYAEYPTRTFTVKDDTQMAGWRDVTVRLTPKEFVEWAKHNEELCEFIAEERLVDLVPARSVFDDANDMYVPDTWEVEVRRKAVLHKDGPADRGYYTANRGDDEFVPTRSQEDREDYFARMAQQEEEPHFRYVLELVPADKTDWSKPLTQQKFTRVSSVLYYSGKAALAKAREMLAMTNRQGRHYFSVAYCTKVDAFHGYKVYGKLAIKANGQIAQIK